MRGYCIQVPQCINPADNPACGFFMYSIICVCMDRLYIIFDSKQNFIAGIAVLDVPASCRISFKTVEYPL